jgi:hypothetical protein
LGSGFRPGIPPRSHPHLHGLCAHRYAFPGRLAGTSSQASLRILFPPDGAQLDLATTDGKTNAVPLKVTGAPVPEQDRGARSGFLAPGKLLEFSVQVSTKRKCAI